MTDTDEPTFYHGTRAPFQRGGWIMPAEWHGGPRTNAPLTPGAVQPPDAGKYVYVTTSRLVAWVYAWCAPGRGRPRVLTVQPSGTVEYDPEHSPRMEAYRCSMAKVLSVDLEPMITEAEAREGWQTQPVLAEKEEARP